MKTKTFQSKCQKEKTDYDLFNLLISWNYWSILYNDTKCQKLCTFRNSVLLIEFILEWIFVVCIFYMILCFIYDDELQWYSLSCWFGIKH